MDLSHSIQIFAVVTICTVLTRVIPFAVFGGKREMPESIKKLGKVLPPAIMAILVVYCLKSINLFAGSHGIPELTAALVVVVLYLWKKNVLLSIAAGTICYMILFNTFFPFS